MGLSWVSHSTLIYTSELILCSTICVHSATRHNIQCEGSQGRFHKLTSVFHASVVLLIMNFVITLQITLTMLWRNSLSITGHTHGKLTLICFCTNCQIVRSCTLTHPINYKVMSLSSYRQWKWASEHVRISAIIVTNLLHWLPCFNDISSLKTLESIFKQVSLLLWTKFKN